MEALSGAAILTQAVRVLVVRKSSGGKSGLRTYAREKEDNVPIFEGKVAIVTGAGAGIGAATAEHLFHHGAKVALASRSRSGAEQIAKRIDPEGERLLVIEADVRDPEAVRGMVERAADHFGALHLAVNNAGVPGPAMTNIPDYPIEEWHDVISTDLTGIFYSMKFELPAILQSGGGAIVNLASANGIVGLAGMSAYTAAKHGVVGLTRTAALEFASLGVRVNAVAPGYVETERMRETPDDVLEQFRRAHPVGRLASLQQVTAAIAFLLSDESAFTTGTVLSVDGGYTAQ